MRISALNTDLKRTNIALQEVEQEYQKFFRTNVKKSKSKTEKGGMSPSSSSENYIEDSGSEGRSIHYTVDNYAKNLSSIKSMKYSNDVNKIGDHLTV